MKLSDKRRKRFKRISMPMILIRERISKFNCTFLGFDDNLADHFVRLFQGNGNHERRFNRQNVRSTALDHFRNFCVILCLSFLIAGTDLVIPIIKHNVRIFRHDISQSKSFRFQKIHDSRLLQVSLLIRNFQIIYFYCITYALHFLAFVFHSFTLLHLATQIIPRMPSNCPPRISSLKTIKRSFPCMPRSAFDSFASLHFPLKKTRRYATI